MVAIREQVTGALVNKGVALGRLERDEDAVTTSIMIAGQ